MSSVLTCIPLSKGGPKASVIVFTQARHMYGSISNSQDPSSFAMDVFIHLVQCLVKLWIMYSVAQFLPGVWTVDLGHSVMALTPSSTQPDPPYGSLLFAHLLSLQTFTSALVQSFVHQTSAVELAMAETSPCSCSHRIRKRFGTGPYTTAPTCRIRLRSSWSEVVEESASAWSFTPTSVSTGPTSPRKLNKLSAAETFSSASCAASQVT